MQLKVKFREKLPILRLKMFFVTYSLIHLFNYSLIHAFIHPRMWAHDELTEIKIKLTDRNLYREFQGYFTFCIHNNLSCMSIHGGRVAKALACDPRGDGFAPHLRRYFRDLFLESIHSLAQRYLKWSVWHCGNLL